MIKKPLKLNLAFLCLLFSFSILTAQTKVDTESIDWKSFLSQHDMFWDRISTDYYAGAIMGNGLLGTNFYKSGDGYRLNIGRVDVTEVRGNLSDEEYPWKTANLFDNARLPIGYFQIDPVGKVTREKMRLSIYDAINKGVITTDKGAINFMSYVHSGKDYILFETEATGNENNYSVSWKPLKAISPRSNTSVAKPSNYSDYTSRPNPPVEQRVEDGVNLSIQELVGGRTYVVAWKELKSDNKRRIAITVSQENSTDDAIRSAKQTIEACLSADVQNLEETHKAWWNEYYKSSFVSLPESKMESFYWAQLYKFASATRADKFILDLQGPWARDDTPWPAIWMNLNIQLTYSWMYTANRSELSKPVWKSLHDNIENLHNNVHNPAWRAEAIGIGRSTSYHMKSSLNPDLASANQYEVANLTWLLFYYWQYCVYNNLEDELINDFFPLLKKSIAYYSFIRTKDANGKYNLPLTASPEYQAAENSNYDLSTLVWGLQTLLDINDKYELNDEKTEHWQDFLDNLVPYPVDATRGYMIGKGVNLTSSHRHYSHLMMIYPYYTVNWEQPENRALITKSINNWQNLTGLLQGYSFTGSSAMYSSMGDGDKAVRQLNSLLSNYIQPNTLYKETGPVIETPLAAVASIHDLYLQSWGGKIRVFHAVPASWSEASFINLRTEGAFLISARRSAGKTAFIQVESEAGGVCRLQTGMNLQNIEVKKFNGSSVNYEVIDASLGLIEIETIAGDVFVIEDTTMPNQLPTVIQHPADEATPYGLNSGPDIPVEGVSLPIEVEITAENPIVKLTPVFAPENAKNKNVIWESSDEAIVKVKNGTLIPQAKGEATVSLTTEEGSFTATCLVKVKDEFHLFVSTSTDDSHVRGGSFGNDNYGKEQTIQVKKDETVSYDRIGFIKFSLSDLDEIDLDGQKPLIYANVYVNTTGETAYTSNILINEVTNSNWSETSLTYNNKPTNGKLLFTIPGFNVLSQEFNSDNYLELDITDTALSHYEQGNKAITLSFFQDKRGTGGGGMLHLASKEHADSQRHPNLSVLAFKDTSSSAMSIVENIIKIYPQIVKNTLFVELKELKPIEILNVNGLLMQKILPNSLKFQIDTSHFLPGVYLLSSQGNTFKFIKS